MLSILLIALVREYIPKVIEPSFGIGRIFYCLFEHLYWSRPGDEVRGVLSFPLWLAPTQLLIVPLFNHPSFVPIVTSLDRKFRGAHISTSIDDSAMAIGKC